MAKIKEKEIQDGQEGLALGLEHDAFTDFVMAVITHLNSLRQRLGI